MPHRRTTSSQTQRDSRVLFNHPGQPTREDLTFDHIPFGDEVLQHGGVPGIEYCWVAPESIPKFEECGPNPEGFVWSRVRDWNWPITVNGPRGSARALQLYGRGAPIPAASPHAGICRWYVDTKILELTGHAHNALQYREKTPEEVAKERDRMQANKPSAGRPPTPGSRYSEAGQIKAAAATGNQ